MIDRNNYETFFLMYVDNELSATEKECVEAFVRQHPDLLEELHLLQQAVLLPEPSVTFPDKELLFKQAGNAICIENCEEKFLLYIDKELSPIETAQVETFVLQHPQLQPDFIAWKQTVLPIENISFVGKEILYRKEEKKKPIVYLYWSRIAIAASLLVAGALFYLLMSSNPSTNSNPPLVSNRTPQLQNPSAKVTTPASPLTTKAIDAVASSNTTIVANRSKKENIFSTNTSNKTNNNSNNDKSATVAIIAPITTTAETPTKINVVPDVTNKLNERNATVAVEIVDKPFVSKDVALVASNDNNNTISHVAYKELNIEANDERKTLLIGNVEINKDKFRGLLRKASRIFGSKPASNNDDVAIASFAVNK